MLRPGPSLLLALCMASLCPGSLGRLSRPSWATLMWDVPDQDLQQQRTGLGSQRSYRPSPAGWLQHVPARRGPALVSPEVACLSCSALCLLLSGALLVCYLCRKAKRHLREQTCQAPSASPETCCQGHCSCKNYELIRRLKENPDLLKRYLRHLRNCYV